ncbi:unnamed protein product [Schistosoma rodhaini]|nr:unnamed protein product [Schistosoma rodhaini]
MTGRIKNHTPYNPNMTITSNNTIYGNTLLITQNGKRRGRKPGLNSTVAQRSAANARERSRMRVLSGAFVELKGALPWVPKDTKLSKLDTLKLAAGYIAYLRRILDTSESHTIIARPSVEITEESRIIRTATSLKLSTSQSNFELNPNLDSNALPDTIKLFNLFTNNSGLKKHYDENYSKYTYKHEKRREKEEKEEYLPLLDHNQQHQNPLKQNNNQQYSQSDRCIINHYNHQHHIPYVPDHQYNQTPLQHQDHHLHTVNSVTCRKFNLLSTSTSSSPSSTTIQPTTDSEFPISQSISEALDNNNNNNSIYCMGYMNDGSLTMKNSSSFIYPELCPNQHEFKSSISSYLDNIYGKETWNIINQTNYSDSSQSLDESELQSLTYLINEKNYEDNNLLRFKNHFHPQLQHLMKSPVKPSLVSDKNPTTEAVLSKSGSVQDDLVPQSIYMTHCMKQRLRTDTNSSLSSSVLSSLSAEMSGSEINHDCMLSINTNNHLSNLRLTRQMNKNIL